VAASDYVQVLTTAGSEAEAGRIADTLVEGRLAACVQVIGPIASTYRWQAVEHEQEWQCLAKTEAGLYEQVEAAIRAVHSYDEPEILAIPVAAGSPGYFAWISQSVQRPASAD
jgi:periplasmic divalent cation tolerance protein